MWSGVRVLKNWTEVGEAIHFLDERGYRFHPNPPKSWDLRLIAELISDVDRQQLVLDLGAANLGATRLFHEMGFARIRGYDFTFSIFDRILQLRDWLGLVARRKHPTRPPYRLRRSDILRTGLSRECASAIACLSVVEHGVDHARFFDEAVRLLRPGGRLFLSTDYWDPKLDTRGRTMFGLPWNIFCATELERLVEAGRKAGLGCATGPAQFECDQPVIRDGEFNYTFAAMAFVKL
jgi:SAM-dependent methyltransferase